MLKWMKVTFIVLFLCFTIECKRQDWKKVLQTDKDGDEIFGSKKTLSSEVLSGSEVRIVVQDWYGKGYVPHIHNIQSVQDNICVQSVYNIGRNRLGNFDNQTYWSFELFCTSGHSHTSRFLATSSKRPIVPETHSKVGIIWFVRKLLCEEQTIYPVYCNNLAGEETCGSRYNLARDVNNGADLRLVDTKRMYATPVTSAQTSSVGSIISAQSLMHLSQTKQSDYMVFKPRSYWWYSLWSSNATCDMVMAGVARKALLGYSTEQRSIHWFSDGCWKMVYSHDEKGKEVTGSLSTLMDAIKLGHRVKMKIRNYTIEADNVQIRNGHVNAQALWSLSQMTIEHFTKLPVWIWEHISTTGIKESKFYNLGVVPLWYTKMFSVNVEWFVDIRKWRCVFSNDETGGTSHGSVNDLVTALLVGRKLRVVVSLAETERMLLAVDNVAISRDDIVSAQSLKVMNYQPFGKLARKFYNPPTWIFTMVKSNGNIETRFSNVWNARTPVVRNFNATIDWFVN